MCGINGIIDFDSKNDFSKEISLMNGEMIHRGPDAGGTYLKDGLALGHRRLSIIDIADHANQPMTTDDGRFTIIFNGEIYNYLELKKQLKDYPFTTNSDTEVVLALFKTWGPGAIKSMNGMFAFSIWDAEEKSMFIYRDRLGIKPLYYHLNKGRIIFSSSIKSILASGLVDRKLNKTSLIDYFRFQTVHGTATMVEGIQALEPGHGIKMTMDQVQMKSYWSLIDDYRVTKGSKEAIQEIVKDKLTESVKKRMVADVPLGAFLSGGIDSSIIVGLMAENSAKKIDTFSVSFEENTFSEAKYAKIIADKFDTNHHEIVLKVDDFKEQIPTALDFMDHPSADGLNTFVVSQATKKAGITVALSGLGGDELFAGYDVFKRIYDLKSKGWLMSFPMGFRRLGGKMLAGVKKTNASYKVAEVLGQQYFDVEYIYQFNRQVFLDRELSEMINGVLPINSAFDLLHKTIGFGNNGYNLPPLSRISVAELQTYLQSILLRDADQMSMAHSLEVRVPFLDHELVETVLGIPDGHKYPKTQKKLLVDSFKDMLPSEIYDREKMGFVLPYEHWMKNELKSFCEENLAHLKAYDMVNFSAVEKRWQLFLKGHPNYNWARMWGLVVLGHWFHNNEITL
jgi:asparagine synthase (glutamine-hydrolysing)